MTTNNKTSFSELMTELEQISEWLDKDDVDLEQAVDKFEKGMELVAELQNRLASAEQKIEKIKLKHRAKETSRK